jgi:4-amino-4-deoxy-L-arabinose transferase-like glycosyltransferase
MAPPLTEGLRQEGKDPAMFQKFDHRAGHYLLLFAVWAGLCLPNLGGPALWDMDEGLNSEAAQEMLESGNWLVPMFNYELRTAKPALQYWCQVAAYRAFGVNEFAARLPSALAALLTLLATYELGRRMFGRHVGLLAGLILASAILFCGAAHFANPDALLVAFTTLTLALFWYDYSGGCRSLYFLLGATYGLAVLVKGPVGLVLPVFAIGLFLLWRWQLRRLLDPRGLGVALLFCLVALPWYVWVGLETKGVWLVQFFMKHHADRVLSPLENHGGPLFYYVIVLFVGLAPWSAFLLPTLWQTINQLRKGRKGSEQPEEATPADADGGPRSAVQFLLCWAVAFFLPFSVVQTKLPNYILPLYPAAAILLAWFLDAWRRGLVRSPGWLLYGGLGGLALGGAAGTAALLVASGVVPLPALRGHLLPGMERWVGLGVALTLGAVVAMVCARRRRGGAVAALLITALVFTGTLMAGVSSTIDRYRAPRPLANSLPDDHLRREVRIASFAYFQPSLVFYCKRRVEVFYNERQAAAFLQSPLDSYLFLPAEQWERVKELAPPSCRLVGRHHDLLRGRVIVVVTNR